MGAEAIPCAASCRCEGTTALLHRPTAHGAGPDTFFASPKKVSKERRPHEAGLRLPLRCRASAGGARNSPDRGCAAPRAQTRARQCSAAAQHRGGVLERTSGVAEPVPRRVYALEVAEQHRTDRGFGPRLSEARGSARSAEIVRVSRVAGPSEQHRAPPQAADSRARLSLVTFFAKTKKVTGRAALKRDGEGRIFIRVAARRSITAHAADGLAC